MVSPDSLLGKALHSLQDSYAHGGPRDDIRTCGGHPCRDLPDAKKPPWTSTGVFDGRVDDPESDLARWSQAMADTANAVQQFKRRCKSKCVGKTQKQKFKPEQFPWEEDGP